MVVSCGHSFGGHMLKKVIEMVCLTFLVFFFFYRSF